ncbi:hypothetical protein CFIO01_00468 [Colletotrichum fioriniae PJ7]|uniref:Uncharacterized protein n=1 Tax=Colletotrichum fioriniae PJ7 TaxID=1445577 RepID=A0A010RUR5_9PEZI|nr:hypothetical protein CFIO01_00468 [Colletotrichum fioriniae PJ7]
MLSQKSDSSRSRDRGDRASSREFETNDRTSDREQRRERPGSPLPTNKRRRREPSSRPAFGRLDVSLERGTTGFRVTKNTGHHGAIVDPIRSDGVDAQVRVIHGIAEGLRAEDVRIQEKERQVGQVEDAKKQDNLVNDALDGFHDTAHDLDLAQDVKAMLATVKDDIVSESEVKLAAVHDAVIADTQATREAIIQAATSDAENKLKTIKSAIASDNDVKLAATRNAITRDSNADLTVTQEATAVANEAQLTTLRYQSDLEKARQDITKDRHRDLQQDRAGMDEDQRAILETIRGILVDDVQERVRDKKAKVEQLQESGAELKLLQSRNITLEQQIQENNTLERQTIASAVDEMKAAVESLTRQMGAFLDGQENDRKSPQPESDP